MKIADLKTMVFDKLFERMKNLREADQLVIEEPVSVDTYNLNHPKGALLIVYKGADYEKSEAINLIKQNKDLQIGVIVCCRKKSGSMQPEEYLDFIREALTGVNTLSNRAERKMYPASEEWIKEENGIWWFAITIIAPSVVTEIK